MAQNCVTVDELAKHKHNSILDDSLATDVDEYADTFYKATHWAKHWRLINNNIRYEGGNQPHNNVQPAKAVYVWRRTA